MARRWSLKPAFSEPVSLSAEVCANPKTVCQLHVVSFEPARARQNVKIAGLTSKAVVHADMNDRKLVLDRFEDQAIWRSCNLAIGASPEAASMNIYHNRKRGVGLCGSWSNDVQV